MKKSIVRLSIVLMLSLAACGGGNAPGSQDHTEMVAGREMIHCGGCVRPALWLNL